jgi:anthranilate synthase/aminodeoxychorismate synthase-like glutamine amidotransferase
LILLVDNYDSFTYNLVQQVSRLGGHVKVIMNDELSLDTIIDQQPEKLIISPGPGRPDDSGICIDLIQHFHKEIPILGICLGHQCLAQAFGSRIISARQLMFGKTTPIIKSNSRLFQGLPNRFDVARYHSLVIDTCPPGFVESSRDEKGDIMSIEHETLPLFGLQFHPESFLMTKAGDRMISNFLEQTAIGASGTA